jgi:hypothetical protein
MTRHILRGFVQFSKLLQTWLREADQQKMLKVGLNFREIADFLVISMNGASALYTASRDPSIWKQTIIQLRFYIDQLRV